MVWAAVVLVLYTERAFVLPLEAKKHNLNLARIYTHDIPKIKLKAYLNNGLQVGKFHLLTKEILVAQVCTVLARGKLTSIGDQPIDEGNAICSWLVSAM